jgi:hypothetical protein
MIIKRNGERKYVTKILVKPNYNEPSEQEINAKSDEGFLQDLLKGVVTKVEARAGTIYYSVLGEKLNFGGFITTGPGYYRDWIAYQGKLLGRIRSDGEVLLRKEAAGSEFTSVGRISTEDTFKKLDDKNPKSFYIQGIESLLGERNRSI